MGVVVRRCMVVIAETEDDLIKRLNEWMDNVGIDMRVNMNKTKVMISGNGRRLQDGHMMSAVEALVIIQYSVLVVRSGYKGNVVV